jgi:hypothetical protein
VQASDTLSRLPKAQKLLDLIPTAVGYSSPHSCMMLFGSSLILGDQEGNLLAIGLPDVGEHSLNPSLQVPTLQVHGKLLVHDTAVTALAQAGLPERNDLQQKTVMIAAASASGAVAIVAWKASESQAHTLTCLARLTDAAQAISSLHFLQFRTSEQRAAVYHPGAAPEGPTGKNIRPDSEGTTCSTACESQTTVSSHIVQRGHSWMLFACAPMDAVHVWRVDNDLAGTTNEASTRLNDELSQISFSNHQSLRGMSRSAAPLCMAVVCGVSDEGHCGAQGQEGPDWLLVACSDRSVKGWPVTEELMKVDEPPVASSESVLATGAAVALGEQQSEVAGRPHGAPSDHTSALDAHSHEHQMPLAVLGGLHDSAAELNSTPVNSGNECLQPHGSCESGHSGAAFETALSADTAVQAVIMSSAMAMQAGPELPDGSHCGLQRSTEAHNAGNSCNSEGAAPKSNMQQQLESMEDAQAGDVTRETQDASLSDAIGSQRPQDAVPSDSAASSTSQAKAASSSPSTAAHESVAAQLSRHTGGLKTADAAKLRPRATALGTQALLSSLVNAQLQCREDSSEAEIHLPGAAKSSADAEKMISKLLSHAAVSQQGVEGKGGRQVAGVRNTRIAVAHKQAMLHLWQGDVLSALHTVVDADALNGDFVAMSAGAGAAVWKAIAKLYAAQLEACGDIHLACSYLCSTGDFEAAAVSYQKAGLLLEAVTLAERHLCSPSSSCLAMLRRQLGTRLQHCTSAQHRTALSWWRADVAAAAGQLDVVLEELLGSSVGPGGCTEEAGVRAFGILVAQQQPTLAAELACRLALGAGDSAAVLRWLEAAMAQDCSVACVAAAVGSVQSMLMSWRALAHQLCTHSKNEPALQSSAIRAGKQCSVSARGCRAVSAPDPLSSQPQLAALLSNDSTEGRRHLGLMGPVGVHSTQALTALLAALADHLQEALTASETEVEKSTEQRPGGAASRKHADDKSDLADPSDTDGPACMLHLAETMLSFVLDALQCSPVNHSLPMAPEIQVMQGNIPRFLPPFCTHAQLATTESKGAQGMADTAAHVVQFVLQCLLDSCMDGCEKTSDVDGLLDAAMQSWQQCPGPDSACLLLIHIKEPLAPWVSFISQHSQRNRVSESTSMASEEALPEPVAASEVVAAACATRQYGHAPPVTVLDGALSELQDLPSIIDEGSEGEPRTPGEGSQSAGTGAFATSAKRKDRGAAERAAARGLACGEVEAYERDLLEYKPSDWAAFRQEVSGTAAPTTVFDPMSLQEASAGQTCMQEVATSHASGVSEATAAADDALKEAHQQDEKLSSNAVVDVVMRAWKNAICVHPSR